MNKNTAGNIFHNFMKSEIRRIENIDKKVKKGKYIEEDHKVLNAITAVAADGARTWSF